MSVILSGEMFLSYAEAYLEATNRLIGIENREFRKGDWNIFAMPLLLLFYHYVELGLKACICMKKEIEICQAVSQQDILQEELLKAHKIMDEKLKCIHDLSELARDMKKLFSEKKDFFSEKVQDYLNRLSNYNKKDMFRYPFDKKGNWILEEPIMPMSEIKNMIKDISRELNSIAEQLIENLYLLRKQVYKPLKKH